MLANTGGMSMKALRWLFLLVFVRTIASQAIDAGKYWRHVYEGFALAISIGVRAFHYVGRDHAGGTGTGASSRRGTRRTTTAGGAFVKRGCERGSADCIHAE